MDDSSTANRSRFEKFQGQKSAQRAGQEPLVFDADGVIRISTQLLFQSAKEIEIEHRGDLYRLRQTALGKLILTK